MVFTEYYKKTLEEGNCQKCAKPRGADGTGTRCKACADKHRADRKKSRVARKAAGRCTCCGRPLMMGETTVTCRVCIDSHVTALRLGW